jgi:hypothetical protein
VVIALVVPGSDVPLDPLMIRIAPANAWEDNPTARATPRAVANNLLFIFHISIFFCDGDKLYGAYCSSRVQIKEDAAEGTFQPIHANPMPTGLTGSLKPMTVVKCC